MGKTEELYKWFYRKLSEHTGKNLEKNGFKVKIFESREEAKRFILSQCESATSIGFGGSLTIGSMNIYEEVKKMKNKVLLNHGLPELSKEEKQQIRIEQQSCNLFLTSANAITLDGKIVNIDGTGNRVNAMTFGPQKVLIVAGANKIVKDVESAIQRIKFLAAPMNAKRLGMNTPCAISGLCNECSSQDRICNITTIIEKKPHNTNIEVLLISESLGL